MSGYASKQEVMAVIRASIKSDTAGTGLSRDPRDYNLEGIFRDAFYHRNPGYGANTADDWTAALRRHRRARTRAREQRALIAAVVTLEFDREAWAKEYGVELHEVDADVREYLLSGLADIDLGPQLRRGGKVVIGEAWDK